MERARFTLVVVGTLVGGCDVDGQDAVSGTTEVIASEHVGPWVALGDDLSPDPSAYLSRPSLVAAPLVRPIVAFSSSDAATSPDTTLDTTTISRWTRGAWDPLGAFDGTAPSIAVDGRERLLVCYGAGPFVKRWNGSSWIDLGGDISTETGHRGVGYQVEGCQGMVISSDDEPIVAWSADVGAKANLVFVARWSRHAGRWLGLGGDAVGHRATDAAIAIDLHGRVVVATFTPGGSYGGGNTTRTFRWDGATWTQLGADLPGTSEPTVAIRDNNTYLAHGVIAPGLPPAVVVMRWKARAWAPIAPALSGDGPAIAFTPSGKLVLAYRAFEEIAGESQRHTLRVVRLAGGEWRSVGAELTDVTTKLAWQAIAVDALGRPTVAWREQDYTTNVSGLFVRRCNDTLP
jgi:hypothetical protein